MRKITIDTDQNKATNAVKTYQGPEKSAYFIMATEPFIQILQIFLGIYRK